MQETTGGTVEPASPLPRREEGADHPALPRLGSPDVVGLAQLWADQFQHLTTVALAGGGGLLVLLETGIVKVGGRFWATLLLFAMVALTSMVALAAVVEEATQGRPPGRIPRVAHAFALACLGSSAYMFIRLFI